MTCFADRRWKPGCSALLWATYLWPPLYCIKTLLSCHENLPLLPVSSSDELLVLSSVSVSSNSELESLESESLSPSTLGLPLAWPCSFWAESWFGVLLNMTTFEASHWKVYLGLTHDLHSLHLVAPCLWSSSFSFVVDLLTIGYGDAAFVPLLLDVSKTMPSQFGTIPLAELLILCFISFQN